LKSESGELFFAARNTRPNRLGSTAIPADFVQRCMRASRSRSIVLMLDCCYGGAFSQGVAVRASDDVNVLDSFPGGRLGGGRGRAVITASSAMEYAFEGDRLADDHSQPPSVFTAALVEGLATGDADRDEDGWISLNELYDYVFDRVREQTPHQTPSRDIEMQGELYLARSRRQRIHPLPLPADLQAAVIDPNMFTRIGAVSELRIRLSSDNLPAALGAHAALAEIAGTDIQYVAEAAAAALREAEMHVVEQELHFGRVTKDSSPAHRRIHVLGPPLARSGTFQVSAHWIRVQETGEGLDVSVDTSTAGWLQGHIALTGPMGEAVIIVDADVVASPQPAKPTAELSPSTDRAPTDGRAPLSTPMGIPQPGTPPAPSVPQAPDSSSPPQAAPAEPRPVAPHDTVIPSSFVPRQSATSTGVGPVLWALMPALSFGILTPVPFAHAARRLHDRSLWLITSAYTVVWLLPLTALGSDGGVVAVVLWFLLGLVASAHAFRLRRRVFAEAEPSGWSPKPRA
jgi:hypothetical protein